MDQNLVGKLNPASVKKFGKTAGKCLAEDGVDRPSMRYVLWNFEYAFPLEKTSSALMEPEDNSTNYIQGIQLTPLEQFDNSESIMDIGNSGTDDDAEDATTSAVFSQLVNPHGRCGAEDSNPPILGQWHSGGDLSVLACRDLVKKCYRVN